MDHIRDARELLQSYNDLNHSLVVMKERYEVLESRLGSIKSQDYTQLFVESNPNNDTLINIIYEKNVIQESIKETREEIENIDNILQDMDKDGELLKMFYIQQVPWQQISMELNLSKSQIFRDRTNALNRFSVRRLGIRSVS